MDKITIRQSGGFTPFYTVTENATGKVLYTASLLGALRVKVWCWRNGYGWPSAAEMNE